MSMPSASADRRLVRAYQSFDQETLHRDGTLLLAAIFIAVIVVVATFVVALVVIAILVVALVVISILVMPFSLIIMATMIMSISIMVMAVMVVFMIGIDRNGLRRCLGCATGKEGGCADGDDDR